MWEAAYSRMPLKRYCSQESLAAMRRELFHSKVVLVLLVLSLRNICKNSSHGHWISCTVASSEMQATLKTEFCFPKLTFQ
jgi:hypothetical protein